MEKISAKTFPLGWLPSDDEDNGRPTGLARIDNLRMDSKGILSNVLGEISIDSSTFNIHVNKVFSKRFGSSVHRYASSGGAVKKNTGSGNLSTDVIPNGGNSSWSAFGSGFGTAFIASGTKKKVDDGSSIRDWGVTIPSSAPGVSVNTPDRVDISVNNFSNMGWVAPISESSTITGLPEGYLQMETDATLNVAVAQYPANAVVISDIDTRNFVSGWEGSDFDICTLDIRIEDPAKTSSVRVEFLLDTPKAPGGTTSDVEDFYYYEWIGGDPENNPGDVSPAFKSGINTWNVLTARRADFKRVGGNTSVGWSNVKGVRVIYTTTESQTCVITKLYWSGGPLNAEKIRYTQVNVKVNSEYQSPSPIGPYSDWVVAQNTTVEITPDYTGLGTDFDKVWIFRQGGDLDFWYRVAELTSGTYIDIREDSDVLIENVKANEYITTAPDNITGIEGPFFDRMLVLTNSSLWISEKLQPEAFDTRLELQIASDTDEICLFVVKVSNSAVLVGTTNDIYEITGPLNVDAQTGILNTEIRPLGVKFPPVSWAYTVDKGILYYEANDGWRALQGSQSWNISGELNLLYFDQTRHDILPVRHTPGDIIRNACVIAHGKLWCLVDQSDYTRYFHVYDLTTKTWTLQYHSSYRYTPTSLFLEEDGKILAGDDRGQIKNLDVGGTSITLPVVIRTFYMDNGSPNTRKDGHTLKIRATSASQVTIVLRGKYTDGTQTAVFTETTSFGSQEEKQFDIEEIGLCKSYQLELTCNTVGDFSFYGFEITYVPRPEQLTDLRIQPDNLGTFSRKRLLGLPIVIDTLGGDVTFYPTIEGVDQTPSILNTSEKRTVMHWFTSDTIGIDVGGRFETAGNVFEFYTIDPSQAIYEKLPTPSKFYNITPTNFGTASRKRFNNLPFVADPRGGIITFTPVFDNIAQSPQTFTGTGRQTFKYYVSSDVTPIDIGATVSGTSEFEFSSMEKPLILEILPDPAKFLRTSPENLGTYARKRFNRISFIIDTRGSDVTVVPMLDGVNYSAQSVNTNTKEPVSYYFAGPTDIIARSFSLNLTGITDFEYYGIIKPERLEILPEPTKFLSIPITNFGTPSRKRFNNIPFSIDTKGGNVTITPIFDGITYSGQTFSGSGKRTYKYYMSSDVAIVDAEFDLSSDTEFEYYEMYPPEELELLPSPVKYLRTPPNNLGTYARKRFHRIPFIIDTKGNNVTVSAVIDGSVQSGQTINTTGKTPVNYTFTTDVIARSVSLNFTGSNDFEYYEMLKPEILEPLPEPVKYIKTSPEDFGTYARKRFNRLAVIIDTKSSDVTLTPVLDGVSQTPLTINTDLKDIAPYFFSSDVVCRTVGYIISGTSEFELYKLLKPELMEILPEPVKSLITPTSNLGHADKKRIRTIPFIINTNGSSVDVVPYIDGVAIATQSFTNSKKKTETYFVETDVFGTDVQLSITGTSEFEFYEIGKLENVEILPVGKKLDQLGPANLNKIGKVRSLRLVLLTTGTALAYRIYNNDSLIKSGSIVTVADKMKPYTVTMPKGINSNVFRVELQSSDEFHRISTEVRLDITGNDTEYTRVQL